MAWTTKAKPKWFINVNKLPDGITVLHAPFSCMLFITTYDKNYASIKNAQMRICVVEEGLFKEQKASFAAKQSHFPCNAFSGIFAEWWGIMFNSWKKWGALGSVEYFWFCLLIRTFLVLSVLVKSGHPQRKHELEHGNENLWEMNHKWLALEVLWNPPGLCNQMEAVLGCYKDHYFGKFQN